MLRSVSRNPFERLLFIRPQFLTTFTISLMKSIDIRSESAVKLLAELLDLDVPYVEGGRYVNAEHFAHGKQPLPPHNLHVTKDVEIYSFVRSPFRDLFVYDSVVQVRVLAHPNCCTFSLKV